MADKKPLINQVMNESKNWQKRAERERKTSQHWKDMFNGCREQLAQVLEGRSECEVCLGNEGTPQYEERYTADRAEILERVLVGYANPNEDPCDECMGTGKDLPSYMESATWRTWQMGGGNG